MARSSSSSNPRTRALGWAEPQTESHETPQDSYFLLGFFFLFPRNFNKRLNCKRRKICKPGHVGALSWYPHRAVFMGYWCASAWVAAHSVPRVSLFLQTFWRRTRGTSAEVGSLCCPGTASLPWQREVWTSFSKLDGSPLASHWKPGNERPQLLISCLLRQRNSSKYILGPLAVFIGIVCIYRIPPSLTALAQSCAHCLQPQW